MKESFKIDYPASDAGKKAWNKAYGMNSIYAGKHWSERREDANFWHMMTVAAMQKAGCRREPFQKPVMLTFLWNDRMDLSNHAYIAKLIEDGMKGRIIYDDTRSWVKGINHFFHDKPYIKIVISELDENMEEKFE